MVEALGAMGKDAPAERKMELVRRVNKIVREEVYQFFPFLENKIKLIKATSQVADQLTDEGTLKNTDEARAKFIRNYKSVVRDKVNQERSYRSKCIGDAVMCKYHQGVNWLFDYSIVLSVS
jgi:hypothetical protein